MTGIILWAGTIVLNILTFSLFQRPRTWQNIKILNAVFSGAISFFIIYGILMLIEHEFFGEYIMWLPIAMGFSMIVNCVATYVITTLFCIASKKYKK